MNWFRLYVDARNDAKLRTLTDAEHRVWFNLLCYAAEQPPRGSVTGVTSVTDVTGTLLLAIEVANGDTSLLSSTIEKLIILRILAFDDDGLTFVSFKKRQYDKPSDTPEETRRRKAEQRERERNAKPADVTPEDDVSRGVTPRHTTEQNRTDTEQNKNEPPLTPQGEGERPKFESIDGGKKPSPLERRFLIFWESYPNKTGKAACRKWWDRRKPDDALLGVMVAAIDQQRRGDKWQRGFIPNPLTWLNEGRWEDEPDQPAAAPEKPLPYNHPRNARKFVG